MFFTFLTFVALAGNPALCETEKSKVSIYVILTRTARMLWTRESIVTQNAVHTVRRHCVGAVHAARSTQLLVSVVAVFLRRTRHADECHRWHLSNNPANCSRSLAATTRCSRFQSRPAHAGWLTGCSGRGCYCVPASATDRLRAHARRWSAARCTASANARFVVVVTQRSAMNGAAVERLHVL